MSFCATCLGRHLARWSLKQQRALHTSRAIHARVSEDIRTRWDDYAPPPRQSIPRYEERQRRDEPDYGSSHSQSSNAKERRHDQDSANVASGSMDVARRKDLEVQEDPLLDHWISASLDLSASDARSTMVYGSTGYDGPLSISSQSVKGKEREETYHSDIYVELSSDHTSTSTSTDIEQPTSVPAHSWPREEQSQRKRPIRRTEISNLPPIRPDEPPPEGQSRFDWRQRSPSQSKEPHPEESLWFPHLQTKRERAEMVKLSEGDKFHAEVKRYQKQ